MINCNKVIRESLQRTKQSQRSIHTASINLKPHESYAEAIHLPLREVVHKKIDNAYAHHKKTFNRSVRLDKSPSTNKDKQNAKIGHPQRTNGKFKISTEQCIETDRKSMRQSTQKSMKAIRLKTDYQELLSQQRVLDFVKLHQVSTIHTDQYNSKKITITKNELMKLYKEAKKLMSQNSSLRKELQFYGQHKRIGNGVSKALCS